MAKNFINIKLPKKPWLRGGIISAGICVLLFLFYLFVYFPIIEKVYSEQTASDGTLPAWSTTIPLVTGHLFPLFSHFIWPYSLLCEFTESRCVSWAASDLAPNCAVPWVEEGQQGCCLQLIKEPTSACEARSEMIGFGSLSLLLIAIYFVIGAGIGWFVGRRKKR